MGHDQHLLLPAESPLEVLGCPLRPQPEVMRGIVGQIVLADQAHVIPDSRNQLARHHAEMRRRAFHQRIIDLHGQMALLVAQNARTGRQRAVEGTDQHAVEIDARQPPSRQIGLPLSLRGQRMVVLLHRLKGGIVGAGIGILQIMTGKAVPDQIQMHDVLLSEMDFSPL